MCVCVCVCVCVCGQVDLAVAVCCVVTLTCCCVLCVKLTCCCVLCVKLTWCCVVCQVDRLLCVVCQADLLLCCVVRVSGQPPRADVHSAALRRPRQQDLCGGLRRRRHETHPTLQSVTRSLSIHLLCSEPCVSDTLFVHPPPLF